MTDVHFVKLLEQECNRSFFSGNIPTGVKIAAHAYNTELWEIPSHE